MKKKISLLLTLLAGIVTANAQTVAVDAVEMAPGVQAKVNLNLSSVSAYSGLSFSIVLPDGVSAVPGTDKIPAADGSEVTAPVKCDAGDDFYVFSKIDGQTISFAVLPKATGESLATFKDGTISVYVTTDKAVTGTPCDVVKVNNAVKDITFGSKTESKDVANIASLDYDTYRLGDANKTGEIDPGDASAILKVYTGKPITFDFVESAADANKTDEVDPGDASAVLKLYAGKIASLSRPDSEEPVVEETQAVDPQ